MKKQLSYLLSAFIILSFFLCISEADALYVPDHVAKKISYQAAEKYPGNAALQKNMISLQTKAYFKVKEFKSDLIADQKMNIIKGNAARQYPYNYVGQLRFMDQQLQKYEKKAKLKKEQEEELAVKEEPSNGLR